MSPSRSRSDTRLSRAIAAISFAALIVSGSLASSTTVAETLAAPAFLELDDALRDTDPGQRLVAKQEEFRNALSDDVAEATRLAKELAGLSVEIFGADHANVAIARTNLALLQAESRDYTPAIQNFEAAVAIFERTPGESAAPPLVTPLRGLADAYMAIGDAKSAISFYERAILVTHVNEGPENLSQVPIAASLSRAWLAMDDTRTATLVQESIYRLRQRSVAEDSDGYIDALLDRAIWYQSVRDYDTSSKTYRRAIQALREHHGESDPRLIGALLSFADTAPRSTRRWFFDASGGALANLGTPLVVSRGARGAGSAASAQFAELNRVIRRSSFIVAEARRATNEAVRVARANAEVDPTLLPKTLVAQGDWMMRRRERNAAWRAYKEAWGLLEADPSMVDLKRAIFDKPALLEGGGFDQTYRSNLLRRDPKSAFTELGSIKVRYNVNAAGIPVNVRIDASEPAGLLDGQVVRGMPNYIYRPAYRDGRPVLTKDVTYEHQYRYNSVDFTNRERDFIKRIEDERKLTLTTSAPRSTG